MSQPVTQMYDMSTADAQELVVGLLRDCDGAEARPAASGPDYYVVVECRDWARAHSIFTLITSVDPGATLINSTNGDAPETARLLELDLD